HGHEMAAIRAPKHARFRVRRPRAKGRHRRQGGRGHRICRRRRSRRDRTARESASSAPPARKVRARAASRAAPAPPRRSALALGRTPMWISFPYPLYESIQPAEVPDENLVGVFAPRTLAGIDEEAVLASGFEQPFGAPRLRNAVRSRDRVLILIDD